MSFMLSHFKMVQVLETNTAQFLSGLNREPETIPQPPVQQLC